VNHTYYSCCIHETLEPQPVLDRQADDPQHAKNSGRGQASLTVFIRLTSQPGRWDLHSANGMEPLLMIAGKINQVDTHHTLVIAAPCSLVRAREVCAEKIKLRICGLAGPPPQIIIE
jgi:hypothetical protein